MTCQESGSSSLRVTLIFLCIWQADRWDGWWQSDHQTRRRRREEATAHPVQHRTEHSPMCPVAATVEMGMVPLINPGLNFWIRGGSTSPWTMRNPGVNTQEHQQVWGSPGCQSANPKPYPPLFWLPMCCFVWVQKGWPNFILKRSHSGGCAEEKKPLS